MDLPRDVEVDHDRCACHCPTTMFGLIAFDRVRSRGTWEGTTQGRKEGHPIDNKSTKLHGNPGDIYELSPETEMTISSDITKLAFLNSNQTNEHRKSTDTQLKTAISLIFQPHPPFCRPLPLLPFNATHPLCRSPQNR